MSPLPHSSVDSSNIGTTTGSDKNNNNDKSSSRKSHSRGYNTTRAEDLRDLLALHQQHYQPRASSGAALDLDQLGTSACTTGEPLLQYRDRQLGATGTSTTTTAATATNSSSSGGGGVGTTVGADTPSDRRPLSDIGTSPSDLAYTPSSSSIHSTSFQSHLDHPLSKHSHSSALSHPHPNSHSRSSLPPPQPINAVLAAFANSDLQYAGIMRPHEGVSYDRRHQQQSQSQQQQQASAQYDQSPDHLSTASGIRSSSNQDDLDRDTASVDSRRAHGTAGSAESSLRHNMSPIHDRYTTPLAHMHSVHSHHSSAAPTAPGSTDQSPHNPASNPYDHATPPQPQGYRPYLASPAAAGAAGSIGDHSSNGNGGDVRNPDGKRPLDDRDMSAGSAADRSRQPWEEGYRPKQEPSATPSKTGNEGSEPPAKKRRRAKTAPNQDIPEGAEVEYEDPSGDRSRGPVFVHPPKGAVQACIRCHRIKRKCDGAWPRCASCARVDVACVFELSAATSSYVHKLKKTNGDLLADLHASQARIHALEMQLANEDKPLPHSITNSEFGRLAISVSSMREHAPLNFLGGGSAIVPGSASPPQGGRRPRINSSGMLSSHSRDGFVPQLFLSDILSRDEALKATEHYFDFNGLAYPFLERSEIVPEMLDLYDTEKERERERQNQSANDRLLPEVEERAERRKFLIYMMLTIGKSHAVRLGDDPNHGVDKALYAQAMRFRAKALSREDMLSIKALLLMTLYSTDVPEAGSLWQTLGLAGRIVMAIGLHRRSDAHIPPEIAEPRRRVFYSFYNMDRFVASTFSKPLTIAEYDIDIELPTDRPTDQPYRGWPIMHICRYLVRYRRLLGCTLTALYSVNGEQNALPEPERRAIIMRLHEELEAWAADGPNPKGAFTVRTINHDKWLAIHYHQMLCMLYRPSPLYPDTTPATLRALHNASSKCVDLYCEMWNLNKVTFNLIQIVGLFVSCISLLCCLCECDTRMHSAEVAGPATTAATLAELGLPYTGVDDPAWAAEIRARVVQCRNLFETFGRGTPLSAKYRDIFTRISELLLARYGPLHRDSNTGAAVDDVMAQPKAAPLPVAESLNDPNASMTPQKPIAANSGVTSGGGANLAGDIAGAWDAMNQLWYDLGDLFGDDATAAGQGDVNMAAMSPATTLGIPAPGIGSGMASGMPGLPNVNVVPPALAAAGVGVGVGVPGAPYHALNYQAAPYGQYAAYAASYPGPYGPYEGAFEEWNAGGDHWRPDGEQWWGHI